MRKLHTTLLLLSLASAAVQAQQDSTETFDYSQFGDAEVTCARLVEAKLALPAYDQCMKASHLFNLLDARGVISVTERASYIGRVRALAKACCQTWLESQTAVAR